MIFYYKRIGICHYSSENLSQWKPFSLSLYSRVQVQRF